MTFKQPVTFKGAHLYDSRMQVRISATWVGHKQQRFEFYYHLGELHLGPLDDAHSDEAPDATVDRQWVPS